MSKIARSLCSIAFCPLARGIKKVSALTQQCSIGLQVSISIYSLEGRNCAHCDWSGHRSNWQSDSKFFRSLAKPSHAPARPPAIDHFLEITAKNNSSKVFASKVGCLSGRLRSFAQIYARTYRRKKKEQYTTSTWLVTASSCLLVASYCTEGRSR